MKQLDKIANTIVANLGNTDNKGLVNGRMGLCLFLYEYAKATGSKQHLELAESLLSDLYLSMFDSMPTDIKEGYAGIGVGLCLLLDKKHAKGSPDNVLKQLDQFILDDIERYTFNDIRYHYTFFSAGIYLLHRLPLASDEQRREWCAKLVEALDKIDQRLTNSENNLTISYISNSVLAVLQEIEKYGAVEKETLDQLKEHFSCHDFQKFYADDMDSLSDRLWFSYLHKQPVSLSNDELEKFLADRLANYPYILGAINNSLAIAGLTLLNQ